jgi:hypothetical protein
MAMNPFVREYARLKYAEHLVECADTVAILTQPEITAIYSSAASGEFDSDIETWWPERGPARESRKP